MTVRSQETWGKFLGGPSEDMISVKMYNVGRNSLILVILHNCQFLVIHLAFGFYYFIKLSPSVNFNSKSKSKVTEYRGLQKRFTVTSVHILSLLKPQTMFSTEVYWLVGQ